MDLFSAAMSVGVELEIRRATAADLPAILSLLATALGWVPDAQHRRFFAWKHEENAFGSSAAWTAMDGDRVVAFRSFLRWELEDGEQVRRAVRAVDTATHPDYRRRGLFSRLTHRGLEDLQAEGVDLVFNTPNEQSRPGYLKMGWKVVAPQLPVLFRPRGPGALLRLARARVPAEKWSLPTSAGLSAPDVLCERSALEGLLATCTPGPGLRTRRSADYLAWRYGFGPLAYRAELAGAGVEDGMVVFRLRRRGAALEAAVCELLVPGGEPQIARSLLRRMLAASGADYAVRLGGPGVPRLGYLPLVGQGPTLVARDVAGGPLLPTAWQLSLGDVELF
ncbi:hypothetical protein BH23ACT1_BH23ACT1_02380 [soil metagenome]